MRTPLIIALIALAASAQGPGRVELFPSVGTPDEVVVAGRTLQADPEAPTPAPVERNLRRLTTRSWVGARVEVSLAGQTARTQSAEHGAFTVTFPAPDGGFSPGIHPARAEVEGGRPAEAEVEVLDPRAPFFVVSDFDDTVAVTEVLAPGKLLDAALLEDETTQKVVEGMPAFFRCLREVAEARPAFALVSGSPIQYEERIRGFLARNAFPPMGLYLRWLKHSTLKGYKQPVIRALMARLPGPVVLVGDSGEQDPEVYREIRDQFGARVLRIYIHDVGRSDQRSRFEGMFLFRHPAEAARDAAQRGLASAGCVASAFGVDGGVSGDVTSPAAAP